MNPEVPLFLNARVPSPCIQKSPNPYIPKSTVLRFLLKVTEHHKSPKIIKNSIKSSFFARRTQIALAEGRSPPQELEVIPCSGLHCLLSNVYYLLSTHWCIKSIYIGVVYWILDWILCLLVSVLFKSCLISSHLGYLG